MAKKNVTFTYEGKQYSATVPEDATREQILEYARTKLGVGSAQSTQTEPPAPQSTLAGSIAQGLHGATQGLAGIAGLPVDAVNAALGIFGVPVSDKPIGGSAQLRSMIPSIPEPAGIGERYAKRVGEEIGATIPTAATGGLARISSLTLPKLLALETGLATASGTGAATANEIFPDSAVADMAGSLVTSFGLTGALGMVRRFKNFLMSKFPLTQEAARKTVGEHLAEMETNSQLFEDNLRRAIELRNSTPGFKPTLAQATGDPAFVALEQQALRVDPVMRASGIERAAANSREIKKGLEEAVSLPRNASPQKVADVLQNRIWLLERRLEQLYEDASQEALDVAARARGKMDRQQTGALLKNFLNKKRAVWKSEANMLYNIIDPENRLQIPADDMVERAAAIKRDILLSEPEANVPEVINRILAKFTKEVPYAQSEVYPPIVDVHGRPGRQTYSELLTRDLPKTIGFRDLAKLRSDVLRSQRIEHGLAQPNSDRLRRLADIEDSIDRTLDLITTDPRMAAQNPLAVERYTVASAFYRQGKQIFDSGTVGDVRRKNFQSRDRTPDSVVAASFLKVNAPTQGSKEAAQDFIAALGGSDAAESALHNYAINDLIDKATVENGGKTIFDPTKAREWVKNHSEALSEFPNIKASLSNFAEVEQIVNDRINRLGIRLNKTLPDRVKNSAVQLYLGSTVEEAVDQTMRSKSPERMARSIFTKIRKDPDAVAGYRKGLYDYMHKTALEDVEGITGAPLLNPEKIDAFVNNPAVKVVYTPAEINRLKELSEMAHYAARVDYTPTGIKAALESETDPKQVVSLLISRVYAIQRHAIGVKYSGTEMALRGVINVVNKIGRQNLQLVLDSAIFDPAVARDLILWAKFPGNPTIKRLRAHVINLGGSTRFEKDKEPAP